jgi:hypothetical protein
MKCRRILELDKERDYIFNYEICWEGKKKMKGLTVILA